MRYIAVFHNWFVKNSYFRARELDVSSKEEAHKEASALAFDWDVPGSHCDYTLVPIGNEETLLSTRKMAAARKLTWKERLFGKIAQYHTEK